MAWVPTAIGLGAGLIGDAFHQGYGQADQYTNQEMGYMGAEGQNANTYQGIGQGGVNNYNVDSPLQRGAANQLAKYYQQDPATDQNNASYVAQATNGTLAAYQHAKAMLTADNAANGTNTVNTNGTPGVQAGGNAAIENAYAGTQASAQNALEAYNMQQRQSNMQNLYGLYGQQTEGDLNQANMGLGAADNIDKGLASDYGNLAAQSAAQTNAFNNGINQTAGAIGSAAGSYFGGLTPSSSGNIAMPNTLADGSPIPLNSAGGYNIGANGYSVPDSTVGYDPNNPFNPFPISYDAPITGTPYNWAGN